MKEGDVVRLSEIGRKEYTDSLRNPHSCIGTIVQLGSRSQFLGVYKVCVEWDNGENNLYKEWDLELLKDEGEHTGGSSSYYDVEVNGTQIRCLDIIEALQMNYAEGNAFKAVWRIAAAKQGKLKKGNTMLYDAEKIVFFGERMVTEHG